MSCFRTQRHQHVIIFVPKLLGEGDEKLLSIYGSLDIGSVCISLSFCVLLSYCGFMFAHIERSIDCSPCLERDRGQPEPH